MKYHYRYQAEYALGEGWRLYAETDTDAQALRDKVIAFLVEKKFVDLTEAAQRVRVTKYRVYQETSP